MNSSNHIKIDCGDSDALVWVKQDCTIDKKTLITVPSGYRVQVTCGSQKINPMIAPCNSANIMEVLGLGKKDFKSNDVYSFYYSITSGRALNFIWGTGSTARDREYEIDFSWGANGEYTISIEDPVRLFENIGKTNPLTTDHLEKIYIEVVSRITTVITQFIADKSVHCFDLNARKDEIQKTVTANLNQFREIPDTMGISIKAITVKEVSIPSDEERGRLSEVIKQRREKKDKKGGE